jgi:hypothetical protein
LKPITRSEAAQGYETALEDLRRELGPTLRALEEVAADPGAHDELEVELPHLQYALHVAAERALGIQPLAGFEEPHEELQVALAIAREETAQVVEVVEEAGPAAADPLVWEWRGALFGVRLAFQRLDATAASVSPQLTGGRGILSVSVLMLGVLMVLGGALAAVWPVWAFGLVLVTVSTTLSARGSRRA